MDDEYTDSSMIISNSSDEESFDSSDGVQDLNSDSNRHSTYYKNDFPEFPSILSTHNLLMYHSTSMSREINGINYKASILSSSSSLKSNENHSINLKNESNFNNLNYDDLNNNNTLTPKNRLSEISYVNSQTSNNKCSSMDITSTAKFLSTPVSKNSEFPIDSPSNSSIRFNPSSLISLPYGYYNNTFTKIRSQDIIFPSIYKKKSKNEDFKLGKKGKRVGFGTFGGDSDINEISYLSQSPDSSTKAELLTDFRSNKKRQNYTLIIHNEYSTNPYKRRYQSVLNERRRLTLNHELNETSGHISLPDRFPKKPRRTYIRKPPEEFEERLPSSPDAEMADEYITQKKPPLLPCYTLPSLHLHDHNFISQLNTCNSLVESKMLNDMIDIIKYSLSFRNDMFNKLYSKSDTNLTKQFNLNNLNKDNLKELNLLVKKSLLNVYNDFALLNYQKGLLKCDYNNVNSEENYDAYIDHTYDSKKLKRLFKQDHYILSQNYYTPDYYDEDEYLNRKSLLVSSPSISFYNGLKCLNGQCLTSNYLFRNKVLTECDSFSGCYLWNDDQTKKENTFMGLGMTGAWTHYPDLSYDILQQNKGRQLNSVIPFINDVCKVAIAEIRIPKPEWSEFTEYNCINGYCCVKCCTCKESTGHTKLYSTNFSHKPLDNKNVNFAVETKIATMDLLKNVMGSCSCYCTCNQESNHLIDRVLNENSQNFDHQNESISWYEIDTSNLNYDLTTKKYLNDQVVQERFILRIKLDSLPHSLKVKVPFTCKLNIELDNSSLNFEKSQTYTPTNTYVGEVKFESAHTPDDMILENYKLNSDMDLDTKIENNVINNTNNKDSDFKVNNFSNGFNKNKTPKLKNFKFINDFTFWDALEILKTEQEELHDKLKSNEKLNKAKLCFDPLEIDTSFYNTEKLVLNKESFATDSKKDSYVEIALYLPYIPSNILPWHFESVDQLELLSINQESNLVNSNVKDESELLGDDLLNEKNTNVDLTKESKLISKLSEYNIVTLGFKKVVNFMKSWINSRNSLLSNERILYEQYKKMWHLYIRQFEDNEVDLFSWGVLPVRAMDLPDKFIPLPAGYKHNDISYPYINQGTTSPYHIHGYGIADIDFKIAKFSQLQTQPEKDKNDFVQTGSVRQRESQTSRRKNTDDSATNKNLDQDLSVRSNNYLVAFFSNLTGPSVRWTHNLIDSLREPLECITDFKSLPIYKAISCPDMSLYSLKNLVSYDRKNIVSNEQLLEDELNYRLSQVWTKSEVRTFIEKYLMYPKNFSKIAQFLENKKCSDCVEFYYRFKYRLRFKQRLHELKSKIKGKFDMTRHLRREVCIMNSLDNIMDACTTDNLKEFNTRNKLGFNSISDYMLRCGSLDSDNKYELEYTNHSDLQSDEEYQYTLDNIAEGYFLPTKYLSMTTRKNVEFPENDDPEDNTTITKKGCFAFDYTDSDYKQNVRDINLDDDELEDRDDLDSNEKTETVEKIEFESDLGSSVLVAMNSEAFFNNRFKGLKKTTLSNYEKILFQFEELSPEQDPTSFRDPQIEGQIIENKDPNLKDISIKNEDNENEKLDVETPKNTQPQSYQGMVTRKKVLSHTKYGYDSPKIVRHTPKTKQKKKHTKWTLEEKERYNETYKLYGKDWNKLYIAMAPFGKTIEQIKNYYHKNNFKKEQSQYKI